MNTLVVVITNLMFFAALAVAVAMLLAVVRATYDTQVTSLLLKLGLGALLTQPFVHIAGARYWTSAAPLFALAIGLMAASGLARTSPRTVAMTTWFQHHPRPTDLDGRLVRESGAGAERSDRRPGRDRRSLRSYGYGGSRAGALTWREREN